MLDLDQGLGARRESFLGLRASSVRLPEGCGDGIGGDLFAVPWGAGETSPARPETGKAARQADLLPVALLVAAHGDFQASFCSPFAAPAVFAASATVSRQVTLRLDLEPRRKPPSLHLLFRRRRMPVPPRSGHSCRLVATQGRLSPGRRESVILGACRSGGRGWTPNCEAGPLPFARRMEMAGDPGHSGRRRRPRWRARSHTGSPVRARRSRCWTRATSRSAPRAAISAWSGSSRRGSTCRTTPAGPCARRISGRPFPRRSSRRPASRPPITSRAASPSACPRRRWSGCPTGCGGCTTCTSPTASAPACSAGPSSARWCRASGRTSSGAAGARMTGTRARFA